MGASDLAELNIACSTGRLSQTSSNVVSVTANGKPGTGGARDADGCKELGIQPRNRRSSGERRSLRLRGTSKHDTTR